MHCTGRPYFAEQHIELVQKFVGFGIGLISYKQSMICDKYKIKQRHHWVEQSV